MRRNRTVLNEENHAIEKLNQERLARKKHERRVKRHRLYRNTIKVILVVAIFYGLYVFDSSPNSRVQTLKVSGNTIFTDYEILEALKIESGDRILFTHSFIKELRGRNITGLESVDVNVYYTKGYVSINVVETRPVAYRNDDELILIFADGSARVLDESRKDLVLGLPLLVGFTPETIDIRMLAALAGLEYEVFGALSEIHLDPNPYDPLAMKLYMNNQFLVYVNIETLPMMYMYATLLSGAAEGKKCIELNEYGPDDESIIANIRTCSVNEY